MGFIPTVLLKQYQAFDFMILSPFFAFNFSRMQLLLNKSVHLFISPTSSCIINYAYCKLLIIDK